MVQTTRFPLVFGLLVILPAAGAAQIGGGGLGEPGNLGDLRGAIREPNLPRAGALTGRDTLDEIRRQRDGNRGTQNPSAPSTSGTGFGAVDAIERPPPAGGLLRSNSGRSDSGETRAEGSGSEGTETSAPSAQPQGAEPQRSRSRDRPARSRPRGGTTAGPVTVTCVTPQGTCRGQFDRVIPRGTECRCGGARGRTQ